MEIEQLKIKRAAIKSRITRATKHFDDAKQRYKGEDEAEREAILMELDVRLSDMQEGWLQFQEIQTEIEVKAVDYEAQFEERSAFESLYFKVVVLYKQFLRKYFQQESEHETTGKAESVAGTGSIEVSSAASTTRSTGSNVVNIKLPQITLPTFTGEYENWLEYRDTFESMIHNNESLGNVQKFHYLRASLKGQASQIIQSMECTALNYSVAWDLIRERYENKVLLISTHIKALINPPVVTKESSKELRAFIDVITKNIRSLQSLDQPTSSWDTLLLYTITSKLDKATIREWEERRENADTLPTISEFLEFLKRKANILETLEASKPGESYKSTAKPLQKVKAYSASYKKCFICGGDDHLIYNCKKFLKFTASERLQRAKDLRLCINCLKPGHIYSACRSGNCRKCSAAHNTLLHRDREEQEERKGEQHEQITTAKSASFSNRVHNQQQTHVLLSTALIELIDANGYPYTARALLDCGAQSNFITRKLCEQHNLRLTKINMSVVGIGQVACDIQHKCELKVRSLHNSFESTITCLILDQLSDNIPSVEFDMYKIPKHLRLADPSYSTPSEVDIILGAGIFWQLLCIGQHKLGDHLPVLQKSKLGWLITGSAVTNHVDRVHCKLEVDGDLKSQIEKFWQIEEIPTAKLLSVDETKCEEIFERTYQRDHNGRFIVNIPMKESAQALGESKSIATRRFQALERRFNNNSSFQEKYKTFMTKYIELDHMSKFEDDHQQLLNYLPHHGVLNENSSTTKLRVVFDGSVQTESGRTFNELQFVGPSLQEDLLSIILRFRHHTYVVYGDIEKMYRQIWIHPTQRHLQCILWRQNPDDKLQTYTLNTVTYGTASAPYLAIKCLSQLGKEHKQHNPKVAEIILRDFYVDDMITGGESEDQLLADITEVAQVLRSGCFNLRKWVSNNSSIIQNLHGNQDAQEINLGEYHNTKTLGLYWHNNIDKLKYKISICNVDMPITKRTILSQTSQIFDPLGLLCPVIINAKIILQNLWSTNTTWDETVSPDIYAKWIQFRNQLPQLNKLEIPRHAVSTNPTSIQLHGFADASQEAFGGLHLLTKHNRDTCSANRVAQIQRLTHQRNWHHIRSQDNPADALSRGLSPIQLLNNKLWWHGPDWLRNNAEYWPTFDLLNIDEIPEKRKVIKTLLSKETSSVIDVNRFSSFRRLQRTTAYCIRFISNSKQQINKQGGPLTIEELEKATKILIRLDQESTFINEKTDLLRGKQVSHKSKLLHLNPFTDEDKIIRVGGRLQLLQENVNKIHPIILGKSHLSRLLLKGYHEELGHVGVNLTLATVREKYWILSSRNTLKTIVHSCIRCFRVSPRIQQPIMGNLPAERINPTPAFHHTGVDYAGPFLVKDRHGRGCKLTKAYICLFICYSTKAVHLELATELSKESFLAALRRFVARRGKPHTIHSDNATNFVAAHKELKEVSQFLEQYDEDITTFLSNQGITWQFIPVHSPHFGGIWESSIKQVKIILKKLIGTTYLTYEHFYTILTQIESILNSRPLTSLSPDPNDLTVLTPGHFLILRNLMSVPEHDVRDVTDNRLSKYKLLQKIFQQFWDRWKQEYISSLQSRPKWKTCQQEVPVGSMVLIKGESTPPLQWPLGRVVEIFPGSDGIVRVASVKTVRGVTRRAVSKLCPLPTSSE